MPNDSNECIQTSIFRRPMPLWLATAVVGAFLGGSGTYHIMCAVGYSLPAQTAGHGLTDVDLAEMRTEMDEMMRGPMTGMTSMMNNMMDRMRVSEQQGLTALVGKLDLLSIGLHIELHPEQAIKLASTLAELDQAEKMTSDEAHGHFDAIQKLLSEEQKTALAAIDLPRGRLSDNCGMAGSGNAPSRPGATPPDSAGPPPAMTGSGMLGPPSDDNPFQQEINQTRLHDFLERLRHSSIESPAVAEESCCD